MLGFVATFVACDLAGWLYHLVGHRTQVGRASHQVHHTGPDDDMTLGLRQTWMPWHGLLQTWMPWHGLLHQPLLALAGSELRVVFVCAALSSCWQVLEHTSLPIRFPAWFAAMVMTPGAHRHHHGRDGGLVNLGPCLTVWDRLAGTWVQAEAPAPLAYGPAVPAPTNLVRLELAGWTDLLGRPRPTAPRSGARSAPTAGVPW